MAASDLAEFASPSEEEKIESIPEEAVSEEAPEAPEEAAA